MTAPVRRLLPLVLIMAAAVIALAALFRPLREARGFVEPSAAQERAARTLFSGAMEGGQAARLDAEAVPLGLRVNTLDIGGVAIAEAAADCRGRGVYVIRQGGDDTIPVAITAPHRGADIGTGPIAQALLREHRFAAGAWNSAPRNPGTSCAAGGDVAHAERHYFTAFAEAFARRHPEGRVVQLHGFDADRRDGTDAAGADVILSDGTRKPGSRLLDLADCLNHALPGRTIRVFGIDAAELGAETNAQGKALRAAGFSGFTHIEMSKAMRMALVADPQVRAKLAGCLAR